MNTIQWIMYFIFLGAGVVLSSLSSLTGYRVLGFLGIGFCGVALGLSVSSLL